MLPILFSFLNFVNAKSFYMKMPEVITNFSNESHLSYEHIKNRCLNTDNICKNGGMDVCAVRVLDGKRLYKHYENPCYLFMENMCKHPGKEFSIISSGGCEEYSNRRRNTKNITKNQSIDSTTTTASQGKSVGRMATLYDVDTAFDFHPCPLSCPDIYEPVCVSVNRGYGAYFKFLTFVNHCAGDIYYCKHWQEFSPPPNEDENVVSSKLGWSFCGSSRYLQFARFSEVTSSMGHYGWLSGNYKYTHIMEPHERLPGHG